jgi:acetolactate synthase-1/2/3 large subunit
VDKIKRTGGGAIVDCLKREGVPFVFGVPGGQTLGIMDALYHTPEIRFITVHDERAASHMADGYARATGQPGVCLATTGPGATNLLTGVGGALHDSSPVIAITANNRGRDLARDDAQEADHIALLRSLTKWSLLITEIDRIPHAVREAFRRSLGDSPGPVHLDFTREILESEEVEFVPLDPVQYRTEGRVQGDLDQVEKAAAVLSAAKSPTIWAGRGVLVSEASDAVVGLAEKIDAALLTTYNGIGAVPADHPLAFGSLSRHGTRVTKQVLAESDVLVVIGNSLNAPTTSRWTVELPKNVIQIDLSSAMIGRHYPFAVGINGDAGAVARQLTSAVSKADAVLEQTRRSRITQLRKKQDDWKSEIFPPELSTTEPIKPQYLMQALRQGLPRDAIIVGGAGNPGIWTNLLEVYEPRTYMKPVGFGNMGFALPAAIGAKLARPDRTVACVIGDGSLGMCISEIETAVRERAPVVIILMDNFGYGNIKQEQLTYFGGRYLGVDFSDIDFPKIARGFGAQGRRVENPTELPTALKEAVDSNVTYLLDVVIDPSDNVWTEPF